MAQYAERDKGFLGDQPSKPTHDVMVIDGRAYRIHTVVVHSFLMGDVEDPDLYAAQPLLEWQHSEAGDWIMNHAVETPEWHRHLDHSVYGYQFTIVAKLKDRDFTFWTLKWNSR